MGIPPEDVELAGRRIEAIALMVVGIILVISGPFLCIATGHVEQTTCGPRREPNWGVFAVVEILGWSILIYGDYLYSKVKHIAWTKQALREYETEKMRIAREVREAQPKIRCSKCGNLCSSTHKFCPECGTRLDEEKEK